MSMTTLEKVLADALAKVTNTDIPAIIAAAQASVVGGCATVATSTAEVVVTEPKAEKPPRMAKDLKTTAKDVEVAAAKPTPPPPPAQPEPEKPQPTVSGPAAGIDVSGLFVGTGADKKVVKDVFLAAVEKAKTLAPMIALNATCDCGFATGDYTEETAGVLKRKLARWGAAQE